MIEDIISWIVVFGVVAASIALYVSPHTRPYVQKYWWVGVAVGLGALATVFLRRRGVSQIADDIEEGKDIADQNLDVLSSLVDTALEEQAKADVALKRSRLDAKLGRDIVEAEIEAINQVDDSVARRKALIALAQRDRA